MEDYNYYGSDTGYEVKCYTSFQGIKRLTESPVVHSLQINVDEGTDEIIPDQILDLFAFDDTIEMTSQLESKAMVIVYKSIAKESIVERLRRYQD